MSRSWSPPYDFADRLRELGVDSQLVHLISRCLANPKRRYENSPQQLDEELDRVGDLPLWDPAPPGFFNVSQLVREYVGGVGVSYPLNIPLTCGALTLSLELHTAYCIIPRMELTFVQLSGFVKEWHEKYCKVQEQKPRYRRDDGVRGRDPEVRGSGHDD